MPRGLDIMIAFVSSTAIIFNLSTYILPLSINRAFSSLITILPTYDGGSTFEFAFTGKCYADNVDVSCLDSILEIARAASTGYEDIDTYRMGHRFYNLMKVVITTYTIFQGLLLLSCYSLLAYEWARTERVKCPPCQRKIVAGYWQFAAICMEITSIAGLLASGVGLSFALNVTSTFSGVKGIDSRIGSGWILHLLATLGYFIATIYFTLPSVPDGEHGDGGCRTPIPPLEGLVNEKSGQSGHIALETV